MTLDGTFQTHLLRTSSGFRSGPHVTNPGYPSLFGDILGVSTRQFLSCRGSRIAPYDRMNVAFLVYADNTVYQICTPTVESHGPDKWAILVTVDEVPGSSHRFRGHARGQFIGQSEAFRVPVRGSWQVTLQKNVNFCQNCVCDAKYAAHPLLCLYFEVHVTVTGRLGPEIIS